MGSGSTLEACSRLCTIRMATFTYLLTSLSAIMVHNGASSPSSYRTVDCIRL